MYYGEDANGPRARYGRQGMTGVGPSTGVAGETVLSHPNLRLVVTNVNLEPEAQHRLAVEVDEDILIFLIRGRCSIDYDGARYEVATHDCVDIERATAIRIPAIAKSRLLVCRGSRS